MVVGKADNGEDAYNMIVRTNPDVVLLDVIMPRMDGISVMEKVRRNNGLKKVPAFIMVMVVSAIRCRRSRLVISLRIWLVSTAPVR